MFIDESGSPKFYGRRKRPLWLEDGFQPVLLLGLLQTKKRKKLRKAVKAFRQRVLSDTLYNSIYSVRQADWFLHAKDDHPEIRSQFFECIREMDYIRCSVIIARKKPDIFINKHNGKPNEFYFDMLHHLIKNLNFAQGTHYSYYLARRNKTNLNAFSTSVERVMERLTFTEDKAPFCTYDCNIIRASECLEMSVLDYLLWAVQRYILKEERRFLTAMKDKYNFIYDIYDTNAQDQFYNKTNLFLLEKITKFK